MSSPLPELRAAIAGIPLLAGLGVDEIGITRLGGLSNTNLRLDTPRGAFVLRLPSPDPAGFVDRKLEIEATRQAAALGLGAELLHADPDTGVLLTRWIAAMPLSAERFRADPAAIDRAGIALATLHRASIRFERALDIFAVIDTHRETLRRQDRLHAASPAVLAALNRARTEVAATPMRAVPSHGDMIPDNLLDGGARAHLIDWEYAAMADPAWDLAYLSLEARFDDAQETRLLAAHGGGVAPERVATFKFLAAMLGALWGHMRGDEALANWIAAREAAVETLAR
jgi:thiamine kinase-like enzyme